MSADIPTTDILGVKINAVNMPLAIETIESWIDREEKHYICICTVHSIMEAQRESTYSDVLNNAGLRTPDGMPLVWLSRRAGHTSVDRVAGPDLLPAMLERSAMTGHRHYFYGGAPGVAGELVGKLSLRYPDMKVAGHHSPPLRSVGEIEPPEIIGQINATCPDIVWVGLGSPKQDVWAQNHLHRITAPIIIAVGAAFDFHSDRINRAPVWIQKIGLEWAFRLSQDPRRLWKRYLLGNTAFLFRLLRR